MNFPTTNPLWTGRTPGRRLQEADAILMVDVDVPYVPLQGKPSPDARLLWIDRDPVKASIPLFTFPAHIRLHADSAKALPTLKQAIEGNMSNEDRQRLRQRRQQVAAASTERRAGLVATAKRLSSQTPIAPAWMMYCLDQVLGQDAIVLDETVTNAPIVADYLTRTQPGTLLSQGGSSLGWALGASVGVKLAAPERTVVALVGDGAFIFGCPTASLWVAKSARTPFLTVIFNNQMYYAAKRSWQVAYPEGYGQQTDRYLGTQLAPCPDYALLAQACHAHGERVDHPQALTGALEGALRAVQDGTAAVVDVRLQRP